MEPIFKAITSQDLPSLLRERDLANRWQVSPRTLQRWRSTQSGPPFIRVEGSIRYRLADIEAYEAQMRAVPLSVENGNRP